ncbi:MAG: hypothetical protein ACE15D_00595 [Candidatus Eisenbacteria bacterium]|nr:hypothetical protein [Candidatus Eisenbacteria bacterium]
MRFSCYSPAFLLTLFGALSFLPLAATPALAGKNAGGAMIVHTNDAVNYTPTGADFCSDIYNPSDCVTAVTQSNKPPGVETMIRRQARAASKATARR